MVNGKFHIVAAAPRDLSAGMIRRLGEILGVTAYDLRLRLSPALPRSLAIFETAGQAESAAAACFAEGVRTAYFCDARMPPAAPFAVQRWQLAADELTATDRKGDVLIVKPAELAHVIFGRRVDVSVQTNIEARTRIMPRGGVSTHYVVTKERHKEMPLFALLVPRDLRLRAALFDADGLAFDCLPGRREPSDNANALRLFEVLRETFPDVPIDQALMQNRMETEHVQYHNRRSNTDPAIAIAYVLSYLRRAESVPAGYFNAEGAPSG